MEIRPAGPDDAPALARLHIRTWQETYPGQMPQVYLDGLDAEIPAREEWWRGVLAGNPRPDVVVIDAADLAELDGWAMVSADPDDGVPPGTGRLMAIYVRRSAWDTGMGSALWHAATRRLAQLGCTDATLWVLDSNTRARRFYERKGWAPDGTTQVDVRDWADLHEVRYRGPLTTTG
jgi:GNAT superfamily N-acetyltransferase